MGDANDAAHGLVVHVHLVEDEEESVMGGLVGGFFVGLSVILWLKMNNDNKKMKEI